MMGFPRQEVHISTMHAHLNNVIVYIATILQVGDNKEIQAEFKAWGENNACNFFTYSVPASALQERWKSGYAHTHDFCS